MFNQLTLSKLILIAALPLSAYAGTILTLNPSDGAISGSPGATVGWGFTLTSDSTDAITFISSFLLNESNPAFGQYSDVIGYQGGPDAGFVDPGAGNWSENFFYSPDPLLQQGVGFYQISPLSTPGQSDAGVIHIEYELDAVGGDCPGCYVASGSFEVPFSITSADATAAPEPATSSLVAVALMVALGVIRRKRS